MPNIRKPAANRIQQIPGVLARVVSAPTHSGDPEGPEGRSGVNIHPADELSAVREELKILETRADELRAILLAEGADLKGDQYTAAIVPGVRETLDRKAITEAFGEAAVAPFVKATHFKTVKLVEN
jgi:hypothetical protein